MSNFLIKRAILGAELIDRVTCKIQAVCEHVGHALYVSALVVHVRCVSG